MTRDSFPTILEQYLNFPLQLGSFEQTLKKWNIYFFFLLFPRLLMIYLFFPLGHRLETFFQIFPKTN